MLNLIKTGKKIVPFTLMLATACAGRTTTPVAAVDAAATAAPDQVLAQVVADKQAEAQPVVYVADTDDAVDTLLDHWRAIVGILPTEEEADALHYEAIGDLLAGEEHLRVTLQPVVKERNDPAEAFHAELVGYARALDAQQKLVAYGAPASNLRVAPPGEQLELLPSSRVGFTAGETLRLEVHRQPYGIAHATLETIR